jgi:hypothetical protein
MVLQSDTFVKSKARCHWACTGDDRFYDVMIPIADKIYDDYLKEIQEENND